jgi:formylglycine-generating enzyme required for sulfatase activity
MGSPAEEPGRSENEVEHEVIITRPFLLQATLVTQAQWTALMGKNPSGLKGVSRPVEMVTWYDALAYCNALSKKMKLDPAYVLSNVQGRPGEEGHVAKVKFKGLGSQGFRLPTEAEWEYACRAGQAGPRYGELDEICWWGGNSGNQTNPVAVKRPNGWGMYDMIGLCWEWCWDVMAPYPPGPLADPLGPESGKERVWRGGCWGSDQENCRAATRVGKLPTLRPFTTGFRVARTVSDTDV